MVFSEDPGKGTEHKKDDDTIPRQEVVVTGIEVPFWDIVATLIWWALAAVPALLILSFVFGAAAFIFDALLN
jgi:hypothetical protein